MTVCFETFGCRLNRAESLDAEARCLSLGHKITKEHTKADMIILRGCAVTSRAQSEVDRIYSHLKKKYPTKKILITGCHPKADKTPLFVTETNSVPTSTARAYLKIQDGCAGNCTFCTVPKFRGKPVSEHYPIILDKAKRFIDAGYHEIVLTGCNLALYASEGKHLAEVATAIASLSPDCRVRLGSVEPTHSTLELVHAINEHENICKFLHLPIQSGSDRVLADMKRGYRVRDIDEILTATIKLMPFIGLGCDLIVGFPGESDIDFHATTGLIKRYPFSKVHAFPFSERPGTAAVTLPNKISHAIRSARAHHLARLSKDSTQHFAKHFIGREVKVVIENSGKLEGWTSEYLWLQDISATLKNPHKSESHRKELLSFKVRAVKDNKLIGSLC